MTEAVQDTVVAALKRRHFQARYAPNRAAALEAIMAAIPEGASVFRTASLVLDGLEVADKLRARGHDVTEGGPDAAVDVRRKAFFADVFMTSPTAITLAGQVIGGDARGDSVAPMIFGPAKVLIVVGIDQVVADKAAAFARIEALQDGAQDPRTAYNGTAMLEGALPRFSERINVIVVGEPLGSP